MEGEGTGDFEGDLAMGTLVPPGPPWARGRCGGVEVGRSRSAPRGEI